MKDENVLKFIKVRNVKSPVRGTSVAAGIDFFIPEDFEKKELSLGDSVLIPSGIKVRIPHGYALLGADKSGVATKKGLTILAKLIDEDYLGEVHIHLAKVARGLEDTEKTILNPGDKIAQFILIPVSYASVMWITDEEYESLGDTDRGEGAFGSTGTK